jgi:hypothetical protein
LAERLGGRRSVPGREIGIEQFAPALDITEKFEDDLELKRRDGRGEKAFVNFPLFMHQDVFQHIVLGVDLAGKPDGARAGIKLDPTQPETPVAERFHLRLRGRQARRGGEAKAGEKEQEMASHGQLGLCLGHEPRKAVQLFDERLIFPP